jgi:epoxyqueuosine reductase
VLKKPAHLHGIRMKRRSPLPLPSASIPAWLTDWMQAHDITLWGGADLRDFETPGSATGQGFPVAISLAVPMPPPIMASIRRGPNRAYADEYDRVNDLLNALSGELALEIERRGHRALALAASTRTDAANVRGDFPHKTAATRAGLGWIGKHCQLITRPYGSWVRLGTVFSDLQVPCGPPRERGFCGRCRRCVDACPARALKGRAWHPGLPREEILDVRACDGWKKEHYFEYHSGHVCGICSAVCPYGLKTLKGGIEPGSL